MLVPEAAGVLFKHYPEGIPVPGASVDVKSMPSPDAMMVGNDPADIALGEVAFETLLRISSGQAAAALSVKIKAPPSVGTSILRSEIKDILHSHGLSSRHLRFVLDGAGVETLSAVDREKIVLAMAVPRRATIATD